MLIKQLNDLKNKMKISSCELILFGIKNCDNVKKAMRWLKENNISFYFYDYKKEGVNEQLIEKFLHSFKLEQIVNKQSTTWRNLSPEIKTTLIDDSHLIQLIINYPTLIKRPILLTKAKSLLGFNIREYQQFFEDF